MDKVFTIDNKLLFVITAFIFFTPLAPIMLVITGGLWLLKRQEKFVINYVETLDDSLNGLDRDPIGKKMYIVTICIVSLLPLILYAGPSALYHWVRKKFFGIDPPNRAILTGEPEPTEENTQYGHLDGTVDRRVFIVPVGMESKYKSEVVDSKIKKHTFK
jgi:hypothetical protein